ncbi:MAG: VOC family protein [Actinobacteria bacterium]|nr:MAG: VOC family protein [Actinomycetota bacterium]
MKPFVLHHVGMSCNDPIAVERWYTKHFGFERRRVYAPGPEQVVMIEAGGFYLELFHSTEERPTPKVEGAGPDYSGFRHFCFPVDDLDAKLAEMGDDAKITLGPLDMSQFIKGMRVAWLADPEGNIAELNQGYVDEENPPPLPPA